MDKQIVLFTDLGELPYKEAWDCQEQLFQQNLKVKAARKTEDTAGKEEQKDAVTHNYLLFVEHPPVYTLGKSGKMEHVLIKEEERKERGIDFFHTNRGGDITFHGPGQVVGYPIFDLELFYTDIGRYLRELEEVIIQMLAGYAIIAGRSPGETGVWIDAHIKGSERKICAMGVRCSRWITMHGFALNVNTDLSYFNHIVPCGIPHKKVTSMKEELGRTVDKREIKDKLRRAFESVFNITIVEHQKSFPM